MTPKNITIIIKDGMNSKINLYIIITVLIILIGTSLTYYIVSQKTTSLNDNSIKVAFPRPFSDGDMVEDVKKCRKYKTFYLNADSLNNEATIKLVRESLNTIKLTGDSTHGIHIELTGDTPYKYYFKTIEICNELPPKLFLPYLNHIYALSKSKYQMFHDSINSERGKLENVEIIEVTGQTF